MAAQSPCRALRCALLQLTQTVDSENDAAAAAGAEEEGEEVDEGNDDAVTAVAVAAAAVASLPNASPGSHQTRT
jgi:hypothetical protein